MKFDWKATFARLTGEEAGCPACNASGIVCTERGDKSSFPNVYGVPYFRCPACGAHGDVVDMVANTDDRPVFAIVKDLCQRAELTAGSKDIDSYIARKETQREVDEYLKGCESDLRASPHLCGIRAGLSVAAKRQLPPSTGIHSRRELPAAFAPLSAKRYLRTAMTLYRYTFDELTTCVDAQNPSTRQSEHRIRVAGDAGVYLGDFQPGAMPAKLVASANPRVAGQIYGAMRAESALTPPVVGIAGFPLPSRFAAVDTLYLLDMPDSRLPLSFAIKAMADGIIYGTDYAPTIRVLSPHCPTSDVTAADIRALSNSKVHGTLLRKWVVEQLLQYRGRTEEVAAAVLQSGVSEATRADLAAMMEDEGAPEIAAVVSLPVGEPDDVLTLGNGKLVKNTAVGLYTAARAKGPNKVEARCALSNVGIRVDYRVTGESGEVACCTVTHPDDDVPDIAVKVPRKHWVSPDLLAEDIRGAYAEFGRTPYVALYKAAGYNWADIMQLLGAHCPVQSGLEALGGNSDGEVNLPSSVVAKGAIKPQTKAGAVCADAMACYSALPDTIPDGDQGRLNGFLSGPACLLKAGVTAGVLHALFCAAARQFDPSGVRRPPAHLLFVETEPGVWDTVIRTLAYVFSGSEYVPLVDYGSSLQYLDEWAGLGTLPLITRLPSADSMAFTLSSSPVSVIAVVDPLTAITCSGRGAVSFVLPNVESESPEGLPQADVEMLREAFMREVVRRAGTKWLDGGVTGATAVSTPSLSALGSVYDRRDPGTVAGSLYRMVRSRYLGAGLTGAKTFFNVLHRAYVDQISGGTPSVPLTFVTDAPGDVVAASFNDRGTHVFILPECAIVSKSVVQAINADKTFLFDAEQLSREFTENAILSDVARTNTGIDPKRVWVFPRDVWDSAVVRAAGYV